MKFDTKQSQAIKEFLDSSHFNHPYKIHISQSGYHKDNVYTFETVVLLLEAEELIKKIKQVDPTVWVSKIDVKDIYGKFDYSKIE